MFYICMRVLPIHTQKVSFKSINNIVKKQRYENYENHPALSNPNVNFFSNYTKFFRTDIAGSWKNFLNIVDSHFSQVDKVNVYCFGCSDGSEAYSFTMGMLDKKGPTKVAKYVPVKAYDIDAEMIRIAEKGWLPCSKNDKIRINSNTLFPKLYCDIVEVPRDEKYPYRFQPTQKVKNLIEFQTGEFVENLDKIEPCNNLLMCRNFWYYLGTDKIPEIVQKLASKIDETSLVVIGDFDRMYVLDSFKTAGFEEIVLNVFRKKKESNF